MHVKDILSKLVAFDTTSRNPNRACIDFIRDYLDGYGVKSEIIADPSGEKACLWATVGSTGQTGVALAGHIDVVPVDGQAWSSDPFVLTAREGKLFGRGAVDMKGFIACILAFVPEFLRANTNTCFHIAVTSDEETDMSGAMRLTEYMQNKGLCPSWIWLGEPTGFSLVDQHKGVAAYLTRLKGMPGHSSMPDKGLNAIGLAGEMIAIIDGMQNKLKATPFPNSGFDPPYSVINLGTIHGGTAENIIAETCEILWQIRAHPGDHAMTIRSEIEAQALARFSSRKALFPSLAMLETRTLFDIPPFLGAANNRGVEAILAANNALKTGKAGFGTEAGIFQKLGVDAVICGPGSIKQAHQPDEFIEENQLSSCVDLMRQVLLSSFAQV